MHMYKCVSVFICVSVCVCVCECACVWGVCTCIVYEKKRSVCVYQYACVCTFVREIAHARAGVFVRAGIMKETCVFCYTPGKGVY